MTEEFEIDPTLIDSIQVSLRITKAELPGPSWQLEHKLRRHKPRPTGSSRRSGFHEKLDISSLSRELTNLGYKLEDIVIIEKRSTKKYPEKVTLHFIFRKAYLVRHGIGPEGLTLLETITTGNLHSVEFYHNYLDRRRILGIHCKPLPLPAREKIEFN
jgi:hypothetical protein